MALVISEWTKNCYLYLYLGRKAQIYSEILGSDSFCLSTGKKKMMQMRLSLLQNWVNYWLLLHVVGMLILSLNVLWEECCQWCWCTPKQLIRSHQQSCKKFFFKSQVWITCAQDGIWKHQSYCNHQQSFFFYWKCPNSLLQKVTYIFVDKTSVNLFWSTGQKIYKSLFRNRPADRNELFQPGRMVLIT